MIREFFAIGMMEYGGVGLLIVVGLFVAALDLVRALFLATTNRTRIPHRRGHAKPFSRSTCPSKQSQTNQ